LHSYGPDFSLTVEVEQICQPLAARVAARPSPRHYRDAVNELIDATHTATCRVAGMLSKADAERRAAHLPINERGQAIRRLITAAPAPRRPGIAAAAVESGSWVTVLVNHVRPYSSDLSRLLGNAAPERRGLPNASEELETALRIVDRAAISLGRRLDVAEKSAPVRPPAHPGTPDEKRQARREGRLVAYDETFDVTAELAAIAQPLVTRVAALRNPAKVAPRIERFADAVHESICEIVTVIARADAARRCAHVGIDERARATKMTVDLVPRPAAPVLTGQILAGGKWVAALITLAQPYREPLSRLLGTAAGPGVSEKLTASLKRIDRAGDTLSRAIAEAARAEAGADRRAAPDRARAAADTARTAARAELARLGVTLS
jgi:uncharacterized protein YhhL (DUF1145 family)